MRPEFSSGTPTMGIEVEPHFTINTQSPEFGIDF